MKIKKIQAGVIADELKDPKAPIPTLWEAKVGEGCIMTINFSAHGYPESELRDLFDWCALKTSQESSIEDAYATFHYFQTHSLREVLAGDNQSIKPISIRLDDQCGLYVDVSVRRHLRVKKSLRINYLSVETSRRPTPELLFEVIIWDENKQPVKRFSIRDPYYGDVVITEHRDNGMCVATWPTGGIVQVHQPYNRLFTLD